jgi:adenosylcobinamide-GDP ribazoletransferase
VSFLREYLVALQFFTRMPVSGALAQWAGFHPDLLRASAAHFPGVGWLVGLTACTLFALVGLALPGSPYEPLAAGVGCTIATVLLTGGFHENGLSHVADGLGGNVQRDQALQIMRDSRIGGYGMLALALTLLAKVSLLALLAEQSPTAVLAALLAAHVLSRFWPLLLVRTLAHVGDSASAKSKPLAERIGVRGLAIGAAWCIAPLGIAVLSQGAGFVIMALLFSGLALWSMQRLFARRLQGFTGDCLGATQQVCEIAFYLGAAVGLRLA